MTDGAIQIYYTAIPNMTFLYLAERCEKSEKYGGPLDWLRICNLWLGTSQQGGVHQALQVGKSTEIGSHKLQVRTFDILSPYNEHGKILSIFNNST